MNKIFILIDVFLKKSMYIYILYNKKIYLRVRIFLFIYVMWGFELEKVIECSEI